MIDISYSSYFYVWYLNNRELRNHKVLKIIISKGAQSDGTVNLECLNWEFRSSPLNELFFQDKEGFISYETSGLDENA